MKTFPQRKLQPSADYYLRKRDEKGEWVTRTTPMTYGPITEAKKLIGAFLNDTCWSWELFNEAIPFSQYQLLVKRVETDERKDTALKASLEKKAKAKLKPAPKLIQKKKGGRK